MSIYNKLSKERKALQDKGLFPDWITTPAYQMLKDSYLDEGESLKERFESIAKTLSSYMPNYPEWYDKFFMLLWKGHLAASTPVLANTGKKRGLNVSCSWTYVPDSISGFYNTLHENAMLTKNSFGCGGYFGDVRPRGSDITHQNGKALGPVPIMKEFFQMTKNVSQTNRRGQFAGYLPLDHPDARELMTYVHKEGDGVNIGWCISNDFIKRLDNKDPEALALYQESLWLKMVTGKGYYFFTDKVNELKPDVFKKYNLDIKSSNLCSEIMLPSTEEETTTCVLSSLNLSKWDEYDHDTIFNSLVFLYCVARDFLKKSYNIPGLEKARKFTARHMALGLGTLGFHTYLQDNLISLDSLEAHLRNIEIFKTIEQETKRANEWLCTVFGECYYTLGTGLACTTTTAIAPNLSSALICGSVSQGIEPVYKNVYEQGSSAGDIGRINPSLLKLMKSRNIYTNDKIREIMSHNGSVQNVSWLDEHEKNVFKTAFEWDQNVLIRLAASRQRYIDQGQSLNLFFSANEDEEYISSVHKNAFMNPFIKSLYYIRSENGIEKNKGECLTCHG